ncbi:hypothetical protein BB560_006304, partial [Smittium megazygosporum]
FVFQENKNISYTNKNAPMKVAFLAQLAERLPSKQKVIGSIPIEGTPERGWFSGIIAACHAADPGSIPVTARWMKRYCQTVGRGNTVKTLQHRYTVNDKTKISAWIKAHNMRNTGSWMDLQMRHPDIKLGLQDIGKIRMGCYWTAQRLAKAGLIPKMYIERCPFCNKNTPETIEHMLIECFRWNAIRHETTIFNIPRLYRTVTIDQSTNNQALNQ